MVDLKNVGHVIAPDVKIRDTMMCAGRWHTFLIAGSRIAFKPILRLSEHSLKYTCKLLFFEIEERFTRLYSGLPFRRPLPGEKTS
jgi:hypothetical protein